jgi:hypothetical protein
MTLACPLFILVSTQPKEVTPNPEHISDPATAPRHIA